MYYTYKYTLVLGDIQLACRNTKQMMPFEDVSDEKRVRKEEKKAVAFCSKGM